MPVSAERSCGPARNCSCPILRSALDPYEAATPPLTYRPYQTTTSLFPFDSTPVHELAAEVAMVLHSGIRPHRRRGCSRRMLPETRGDLGMAATGGDPEQP